MVLNANQVDSAAHSWAGYFVLALQFVACPFHEIIRAFPFGDV
jgi:hypothetical protein